MAKRLTDKEIQADKTNRIMNLVAWRAAFYREHPHRFVEEYLGIQLKDFQKVVIYEVLHNDNSYFIGSRGIGKTFLIAIVYITICLLYPGSKIVNSSYTFKQGKEIISKITDELMPKSPLLKSEIKSVKTGINECIITFKCGSFIRIVTATETSRGARSNVLGVDESRLVPQKILDTVLRPMNASPRQPMFLQKKEYSHLKEMNKEIYMSSAYYSASEMFERVKSYFANMLNPKYKYFVIDLPYMVSIKEGLLMKEQIENEISESSFNSVAFSMEREGLFYGSAEDALFDYKTVANRRVINEGLYSLDFYKTKGIKVPDKKKNELRILSVDVALLASKKHDNDASAIFIHSAIPTTSHNYIDNVVYADTKEGLVTDELGLLVMRYYYQYDCDYIVLDSAGIGIGVLDYIMNDRYDPEYGQAYGALNVCNNPDLEERCKVKGAPKVIYAIKASARSNNDMCLALRSGFQNGNINLLVNETDAEDILSKIKGYGKMSDIQKTQLKLPYVQTTLLINELINLTHELNGGLIRVKEKTGMRKDRYSSLMYGYNIIQELSKNLKPKKSDSDSFLEKIGSVMRKSSRL